MPSVLPNHTQHGQIDLTAKTSANAAQETLTLVVQLCATLNYSLPKKEYHSGLKENKFTNSAINDQRAFRILQDDQRLEKETSFTKETLGSYNAKLISSIVISQMIDENKSEENGPALPMQPVITQPNAYCIKQSWTNHNLINSNRAFIIIPCKLRTETSLNENASGAILCHREEKPNRKWRKGFTSITITARQIRPSLNHTLCGASGEPLCLSYTSSNNAGQILHHTVLHHHGSCQNGYSNLISVQQNSVYNTDYLFSLNYRKKAQASFTSCVYLKLSYQYPSTIYYIDKSKFVSIDQPQIPTQTIHRSVLFINICCSSSRPTPDGVNGLANKEPIAELQESASLKERLLKARNAEYMECNYIKNQLIIRREQQTAEKCDCEFLVDITSIRDHPEEAYLLMAKDKTDDDHSEIHSCIQHRHYLKVSDGPVKAGESNWCNSFEESKQCKQSDEDETARIVPVDSLKAIPEEKETSTQTKESWKSENIPPRPLTLREALELFRPDFISRSRKRLQQLELMRQIRKAQVSKISLLHTKKRSLSFDKPSSTPIKKKLYTVPHPLSDNLFKPKGRIISKKEMQLRSKRIYNNLPEVRRKKEEEKKRLISQSNRLQAELFKKKLLDQILQRNGDC